MKAFRDFGEFKGLVIDEWEIDGKYRVARPDGTIRIVTREEFKRSTEVVIQDVDKAKIEVMDNMYQEWASESILYKQKDKEKQLAEDWRRIFIDDVIVSDAEFRDIFNREMYYRTYGELQKLGYKFYVQNDGFEFLPHVVYKEYSMPEELKRRAAKLKLVGLNDEKIRDDKEFRRMLAEFIDGIGSGELYEFKIQDAAWGMQFFIGFETYFEKYNIMHACGFTVEDVPLTRELAIEVAERMLGRCRQGKGNMSMAMMETEW